MLQQDVDDSLGSDAAATLLSVEHKAAIPILESDAAANSSLFGAVLNHDAVLTVKTDTEATSVFFHGDPSRGIRVSSK